MQLGVVDANNAIVSRLAQRTESSRGSDQVIAKIIDGIKSVCEAENLSISDLKAVGIAAAGAIDIPRGIILQAPNLQWTDIPLRDRLSEELKLPVVLDNDVNGAVWGEFCAGAGRGSSSLLGVWVGTGVGGGLVFNQQLYHGPLFTAGEIGHTVIFPDEDDHLQILEQWSSRTGMRRNVQEQWADYPDSLLKKITNDQPENIGTDELVSAYQQNDPLACKVINQAADLLGTAIANCITLLALDRVVIGGGMTEVLGEPFMQRIRASFAQSVFPARARSCQLLPTELAADAGLLGAAFLARGLFEVLPQITP